MSIGAEDPVELKRLSDRKALTCPVCNSIVTLHAGRVRAHHFAHLPGANCFIPHSEPESEEHRTGKLELANWLRKKIPDGKVTLEAWFPETKQRADVYLETTEPGKERVALEFQCANLSSREWHRRHSLYRQSGILDLWFLGGSRFHSEAIISNSSVAKHFFLRTTELERTLILAKAPLLFLTESVETGEKLSVSRFRPSDISDLIRPVGRVDSRLLKELEFPWKLLINEEVAENPLAKIERHEVQKIEAVSVQNVSTFTLLEWLKVQHRVNEQDIPEVFGIPTKGAEAFACSSKLWQASLYYRFIQGRIGEKWFSDQAVIWARIHLPLTQPVHLKKLQLALAEGMQLFSVIGFLQLNKGGNLASGKVVADLNALLSIPERYEIERLLRYRRTRQKN